MAVDPLLALGTSLLACLQQQYPAQGTAPGDFCLRAGEDGSIVEDIDPWTGEDLCCSGLGFVRLGRSYPSSSNFPEPDSVLKRGSCYPVSWASELQVGILRCYHPGGLDRTATCPEHTQAATNYATDMYTLKCAMACWVQGLPKGRLYQVVDVGPSGPRGNCIQTIMNIIVQTPNCPC
jgi:hypothetical protein